MKKIEISKEESLIKMVCDEYGISTKAFNSNNRIIQVCEARYMVAHILTNYMDYSHGDLARLLGWESHRVTYALHKMRDLLAYDRISKRHFNNLMEKMLEA